MPDSFPLPPPSQPAPLPVPIWEARIDPPQDVTAAMAMIRATCSAWKPVSVQGIPQYSAEAKLCDQITGRTQPTETAWHAGLGFGIAGTLAAVLTFIVVRDIYRGIRRVISVRLIRPSTTPTAE